MKFSIRAVTLATAVAVSGGISAADTHAPHWGYDEAAKWGDLSGDFKVCKIGKEQSPIDIQTKATEKAKLVPIGFNYKAGAGEVVSGSKSAGPSSGISKCSISLCFLASRMCSR